MPRPKLDLTDEERYELHKKRCREYKQKRVANDPEYKEKCRLYNTNYFRTMRENAFLAKELREKQQKEQTEEKKH